MSKSQKKKLIRIIIAATLFVAAILVDKFVVLSSVFSGIWSLLFPLIIFAAIYILISYDIIGEAVISICHGQLLDENFLMIIASIGAFVLGAITKSTEEFYEANAVMILFQIGEFFQDYAVNKSRKSISSLMDIRPDYANILVGEEIKVVSPEEVKLEDIIVVKPGEKIPLDGIVVKGSTSLDTKAITGESLPYECKEGDQVVSGSINLTSIIHVKVLKEFYDSTVSKILDLVENASFAKSKSENFITKFAKFYTPIVVGGAVLLTVIGGLVTGDWLSWLYRSLNFLVVSCPCALVISVPLTFFVGLGQSSKGGILVKGSNYLERYAKSNIFVFDKTGTLTKGNFAITKVVPENKTKEILKYASIAESQSNHPIAKSIMSRCEGKVDLSYSLEDVTGKGIKATKGEKVILCGNYKLMNDNNIKYDDPNEVGTIIHVAVDNEYLGYIVIEDEIKDEAYAMINYLNSIGAKSIMLTGDNEKIASHVANKLGITNYFAGLLPQDKVAKVNELLANRGPNDVICFVGDGINDAPVLMASDIGISMGQVGSDAAIEASDIVLMKDNLDGIKESRKIAKKTISIVTENIIISLGVKLAIMIISAFGIGNLWLSIFGDVGVCFIAILNALRVGLSKKK